MGAAIGLAAMIVVLGIFLPHVLNALEDFLLAVLIRATAIVEQIRPEESASMLMLPRQ